MALCCDCKGFHFNFKMIPCLEVNEGERFSVRNKGSLASPTCALQVSRLSLWRLWRWPALCQLKNRDSQVELVALSAKRSCKFMSLCFGHLYEMKLWQYAYIIINSIVANNMQKCIKKVGERYQTEWWRPQYLNSFLPSFFPFFHPPSLFFLFVFSLSLLLSLYLFSPPLVFISSFPSC